MYNSALDNFESSLCLINRMSEADAQISFKVKGKICLNIGLIRAQFDSPQEAIVMLQQAIEYKKVEIDQESYNIDANFDELRDQYVLLAHQQ